MTCFVILTPFDVPFRNLAPLDGRSGNRNRGNKKKKEKNKNINEQ